MRRAGTEQGGLAITAVIILVGMAVLGYAIGWMQLRGVDITVALAKTKPKMERLLDLGQRIARSQLNEQCELSQAPDHIAVLDGYGRVEVLFQKPATTPFHVRISVYYDDQTRQQACTLTCQPAVTCPAWMTPEQCAGGGGGGPQLFCAS